MPTEQINGWDLHYEERGTGEAVLGIHGTPSSAALWEDAATALARLGRCLTYDRRGFHRSSGPPLDRLDLADHVSDACALLDARAAQPAVVIGRSTGGLIGLALGLARPDLVRALVLLEPAVFAVDPEAKRWADGLRETILAAELERPGSASRAVIDVAMGAGAWDELPAEVRELFGSVNAAVLAEIHGTGLDLSAAPFRPSPEQLAGLGVPTLVVSGEGSYPAARLVDDRLVEALPDVRHLVVPGGHLIDPAHPGVLEFVAAALRC